MDVSGGCGLLDKPGYYHSALTALFQSSAGSFHLNEQSAIPSLEQKQELKINLLHQLVPVKQLLIHCHTHLKTKKQTTIN